ncbi:MAG: tetratricopeptide repeat protein, partial [Desulfosalsimonas sp.]
QGLAHLKADEPNAAKTSLAKIGPDSPEYVSARLLMARIHYSERNFTQAEEACRQVLEASPNNIKALSMLGNIHVNQQEYEKAAKLFEWIISISEKEPAGYYNLGIVHRLSGRNKEAAAAFESALLRDPSHMLAFVNLVEILIEENKMEKALEYCDKHIDKFEENPEMLAPAYNLKGRLMVLLNKPEQAEQMFKKALIEDENYLPSYYSLASLYSTENRSRQAIAHFKNAAENNPGQVMPHMMLGILNCMEAGCEGAIPHYRKALEINPDFVAAANNLAYVLAERDENLNEALELAERAKEKLPDDPRVADTLGWVYYKMGLYDSAIREFSAGMEKLPGNPTIQYHMGMAYYKKGYIRRAQDALEKSLELDPNFENSSEARETLTNIKEKQTG